MFGSRHFQERYLPAATGLVSIVAALAAIEALIRIDVINRFVVPPPLDIVMSFGRVITEEGIPQRLVQTGGEALAAGVLAVAVGLPLGFLLYRHMTLRLATESWVAALASAPLVLAYPLFLVMFGRSPLSIIMMGFVSGVPPVILKTVEGLSGTRKVLVDVGRSLKMSERQLVWKVLLPAATPTIFVGLRLGLIFSLINVVAMEFLINLGGLGQLINELAERYDLPGTYAAIFFVVLVSIAFFMVLGKVERWLRPAG
jgi:ABC-type nitrate/sulfonate/bicarbonate transport system permease component